MLTTKLIGLHTKCTAILQLIQTVNDRIVSQRTRLSQYDNESDIFHVVRLTNLRCDIISDLDHYKNLKSRLVESYTNVHMLLSEDALEKCARYFDFIPS